MLLSEIWFLLIVILFVGFIFLEGYDYGVGMGTQFLARNDLEKRMLINSIGPFWDANEVWLITAGGAMFAAFPHWYATIFSGFYIPFAILLLALIGRGVAFEFRGKSHSQSWQKTWDIAIFIGSILPPFLVGVLFSSMIKGLPVDGHMNMYATFTDYVNLYTVVSGIAFVLLSYLHGLMFVSLKTDGPIRARAKQQGRKIYLLTGAVLLLFVALTGLYTDAFSSRKAMITILIYSVVILLYLALFPLLKKEKEGLSFTATGLVLILVTTTFFIILFPNVVVSSIDPNYNISLYAAASGDYSLRIMTFVALTLVPIILGYTIWSYYIFRKRITEKEHLEY